VTPGRPRLRAALGPFAALPLLCAGLSGLSAQEAPRPNRHPLLSIFPDPLPDGRTSVAVETANQFLRPEFQSGNGGRTLARFDGEDWGLTLDYARRAGPMVLNLRLRGLWRSAGWTDQIFAAWHALLSTPTGGREQVPDYRLEYMLSVDGRTVARLGSARARLMDVDLAVLLPFGGPDAGGRVGASVQAPTGKSDDFSGSGGWDWLVGAALWKKAGPFTFHAQLERAFLGVPDGSPYALALDGRTQKRIWAGTAFRVGGLGVDASIAYAEGIYATGIPRLDRSGWQQHWTFSHARLPKWRAGFTEEAGTYLSPDLTAFVQWRPAGPGGG
jgi:hypothetical protein